MGKFIYSIDYGNIIGAVRYKGVIDCSTNPNYPAAESGHVYVVSVAGKIGGISGISVSVGDQLLCKTDASPAGDEASVGANWNIVENIDFNNVTITGGTLNDVTIGNTTPDVGHFTVVGLEPTYVATGVETEGETYWDNDWRTLTTVMTDDVKLHQGQELHILVKNTSASLIQTGKVVMYDGTDTASSRVKAKLADVTQIQTQAHILGLATHDIPVNGFGKVTWFGNIDYNTSGFLEGTSLYLDPAIPGALTSTVPSFGVRYYIGVTIDQGVSGHLFVTNNTQVPMSPILDAIKEPTGFPDITNSDFTFTNATRTLEITPTGDYFEYYIKGDRYRVALADNIIIANTTGVHFIYYDIDGLHECVNPSGTVIHNTITEKALVSILYWNATSSEAIYVGEERHGTIMDGSTHEYLHYTNGLAYHNGLGLNSILVNQNGSLSSHAQFGIDSGAVSDEDIYKLIDAISSTIGVPIYYMTGTNTWNRTINSGFSCRTYDNTSATRLAYNQLLTGVWQLTQASSGYYVLYHIFATTEKNNQVISMMGQAQYSSLTAARTGAKTEALNLITNNILFPEIRLIGTVIFQTNLSYTNVVNARIVDDGSGGTYIDWRNESISRVAVSTSDHNSLSGKQGGVVGEYYHLTSAQTTEVEKLPSSIEDVRKIFYLNQI